MKSLRLFDRRAGYSLASLGLLLGMIAPGLIPAFASAGSLATRSISMSTADPGAAANYELTFTPTQSTADATGGLMIDFCKESPLIDTTCTTPTDFTTTGATADVGTITASGGHIKLVTSLTGGTQFTVTFTGVTNPSTVGTFYARVVSYSNTAQFANYQSASDTGTHLDEGAVALSTTNTIGVTAYVLESMTFCVSGQDIAKNCGDGITAPAEGSVTDPSMQLGQTVGTVIALDAQHVSQGDAYAQLSTNAANGAIVNLKSDATGCGGLYRNGVLANCEIGPQSNTASDLAAGTAGFGLKVGAETDPSGAGAADMTGDLAATNNYNATSFYLQYVSGDTDGVTGPYGSAIFNSAGAPVSNKNIPLTFGAAISNQTPAGKYGANLSLIATGTF